MLYEINVFKECLNGKRLKYYTAEVSALDLSKALSKTGVNIGKGRVMEIRQIEMPQIRKASRNEVV